MSDQSESEADIVSQRTNEQRADRAVAASDDCVVVGSAVPRRNLAATAVSGQIALKFCSYFVVLPKQKSVQFTFVGSNLIHVFAFFIAIITFLAHAKCLLSNHLQPAFTVA